VSPEAVAISGAKIANVTIDDVLRYLGNLRCDTDSDDSRVANGVKVFFHERTLREIMAVARTLMADCSRPPESDIARLCLGCLVGILHGHAAYSLSLPCAHAYSMSPAYVQRYAKKHGLRRTYKNVTACIAEKAFLVLRDPSPTSARGSVKKSSVLDLEKTFPGLRNNVDIILTSPPYLNAQTYGKDNWLRLWLLGYNHKDLRSDYIETGSVKKYGELMKSALIQMRNLLRVGGRLVLVCGTASRTRTRNKTRFKETVETGDIIAGIVTSSISGLTIIKRDMHLVQSHKRYFHSLHESNGHSAHVIKETILVCEKDGL
jgi:hypothetical protein